MGRLPRRAGGTLKKWSACQKRIPSEREQGYWQDWGGKGKIASNDSKAAQGGLSSSCTNHKKEENFKERKGKKAEDTA